MVRLVIDFTTREELLEFFEKMDVDGAALFLIRPDESHVPETYVVRREGSRPDNERLDV